MLKPNIRFSKFDGDFKKIKLGKLASKVGSGSTPKGGSSTYVSIGIPLIRSQNVKDGYLDETDFVKIDLNTHSKMKSSHVYPNDVLLNITGASIGRSCVVPKHFIEGNVNQHVCIIRPKNKELVSTYLNYYLSSKYGQKQINISQAGGGREGLNFEAIRGFNIPITSDTEQQKIADFLTAVDTKINQLTEKHRLLKEYKKGVMQQIFSQQLRFKDKDGKAFPEWKSYPLKKVLSLQSDTLNMLDDETYELITVKRGFGGVVSRGLFKGKDVLVKNQFTIHENEFVISKRQIVHGACGLVPAALNGAIVSNEYNVFRPVEHLLDIDYFNRFTTTPLMRRAFFINSDGVHIEKLLFKTQSWLKTKVTLPCLEEQQKIAQFLQALDSKIAAVSEQIEQTKQFKKGLLQQMFV
ncbi:TPA: restriction endonuclease subunit S [Vibrio cholerae]